MPNVHATVREQRLRRGWTIKDLAQRCTEAGSATSEANLYRIECEGQVPRPALRATLAELLDLDVADFERQAS